MWSVLDLKGSAQSEEQRQQTASAAASHSILKSLLRNFLDGIASPDTSEWLVYYLNNFHTIFWVGKQINLDLLYIPEIWHQETHQSVILLSKWTQPDISKALRPILSGVGRVHFLLGRQIGPRTIFEYLIGFSQIYFKFQTNMYISKLRQILSIQYLIGWFVVVAEGRGSIWRAGLACRERPHVVQTSPPDQLGQVWISLSVYVYPYISTM